MIDLIELIEENLDNVLLDDLFLPELGRFEKGKVRDIYVRRFDRAEITSDRVSAFDVVSKQGIPFKGQLLNFFNRIGHDLAREKISDDIINEPDLNVLIKKNCKVYPIEFVVRRYLLGSAWGSYEKKGEVSGIELPKHLGKYHRFKEPIITPTTKAITGHDQEISKEEILSRRLIPEDRLDYIYRIVLGLFLEAEEQFSLHKIKLQDTKYEFSEEGIVDEIHTPDSSRIDSFDKQYLRDYLRSVGFTGEGDMPKLPEEVIIELSLRYLKLARKIMPNYLPDTTPVKERIIESLKSQNMYIGRFALILTGSEKDQEFTDKIQLELKNLQIPSRVEIASGHKNPKQLIKIVEQHNKSSEPMINIPVAGLQDDLSGIVASNSIWPTIACPPDDKVYAGFPSNCPVAYIPCPREIAPRNTALAAAKIFSINDKVYKEKLKIA